jgi:hypothetical protein
VHWRSLSKNNVLTIYGKGANSRIAAPAAEEPKPVFSWLISETRDDKGNAILYEYAEEDDARVDLSQNSERHRRRTAYRYPKRIRYGNRTPLLDGEGCRLRFIDNDTLENAGWLFEVVFDCDQARYHELNPDAPPEENRYVLALESAAGPWPARPDPFSSYRAGFEVRTHRRFRRVLMFHHIPDLPGGAKGYDGLVRSTEFDYVDFDCGHEPAIERELEHPGSTRFASLIRSVTQSGFVRVAERPAVLRNGVEYPVYLKKFLPPLEFEYRKAAMHDVIREAPAGSLENLPEGIDGAAYQWVDLDGEGISGILTEQAGAWF